MYRSPFKATSRQTTAFKVKGSWAAGYHTGIDRVCDSNKTMVAPTDGTILRNEWSSSYGNFIIIKTNDGKVILMAHMASKSPVKVGEKVKMGDTIGTMGSTGNSSGLHLHIEIENSTTWAYNTKLLNPNDYINWNDTTSVTKTTTPTTPAISTSKFVNPVAWQNGSTKEAIFKQSNLSGEIGTVYEKSKASCYGKQGNYILVYDLDGTNKHKVGFAKYAGGVKTAPTGGKTYKNGSTSEIVYADTAKKTVVGSLDPREECKCLAKIDGMYLILYKINGTSNYKCGFTVYNGGC